MQKKLTQNKREKKCPPETSKKPVLASEREAHSRLEHCRKNVSQLLDWQRLADRDATEMMILCLHIPATPVVFGRAWRRDLDHVYRVSINIKNTTNKYVVRTSSYNL